MQLTGKVILILFFIAIVFYNIRHARAINESFATINVPIDSITSTDIYSKNKPIMCDTLYYGSSFLTDATDMFQARYCIKYIDPNVNNANYDYAESFKKKLADTKNVYVQSILMDTMEMESVRKAIQTKLYYFKMANTDEASIQGPVYAILTQAPYLLDDQGDVIYHQPFNRDEYPTSSPVFAVSNKDKVPPVNGVRVYIHLVYMMYDKNRKPNPVNAVDPGFDFKPHFIEKMHYINSLRVDDKLCNINCINDGGLLCGCVNQTEPYVSHCLGEKPGVPAAIQNYNQLTDFMMVYRINEKSPRISPLFSEYYFEDVKI